MHAFLPWRTYVLLVLLFLALPGRSRADDWPQWLGPQRDGVWRESGILEAFPPGGPKVLWRAPIGPGFTGPAVSGGRVYVMDRQGKPLARGAESSGKDGLPSKERILCLSADNGRLLWEHAYECTYKIAYPSGPRTTPVVHQGKVYTLGTMGDLWCLDAVSGKPCWSHSFVKDYGTRPPLWGWSAHLLVAGGKVFSLVGGEDRAVMAFDKDTGKELWHALTVKEIGYAPPILVTAAGQQQLIAWHTEAVNALDPGTGKVIWSVPFPASGDPVRPAITVATPQLQGDLLLVSSPHHGSLLLRLTQDRPGAVVVWQGKSKDLAKSDGLHSLTSTPAVVDGHIYGICAFGELRCLKLTTGERLWQTYAATSGKKALFANAFLVRHGNQFLLCNDGGDLILARLTPQGYTEIGRAHLLEPTLYSRGRDVVWSHPAFANRCLFARNDQEIICVSLAADQGKAGQGGAVR
jgi:outer membrane protein assembly factor BamB